MFNLSQRSAYKICFETKTFFGCFEKKVHKYFLRNNIGYHLPNQSNLIHFNLLITLKLPAVDQSDVQINT